MNAMHLSKRLLLRVVVGALALALLAPAALLAAETKPDLAALVASMPNCDPDGKHTGPALDVAQKAVNEVLQGGKDALLALVAMLKEPSQGEDYKARYLLHAVATHAARPDAEEERKLVCEALAIALDGPAPTLVKGHLLEELKWIGRQESVAAISKFLLDEQLHDFAAQALVAIRQAALLREALPKAQGGSRVALVQALGVLRDAESVPALIAAASDADAAVRLAAVEALGNVADPRGVDAVLKAAALEKASYEEMKAAEAALRLGQRLVQAGKADEARRIYTTLPKQWPGKAGRHIRIASLRGLAAIAGEEILGELLAALADPDLQVRTEAARTAAELPGGALVDKWLALLEKAPAKDRPGILFVLGSIGDPKALPAVLQALGDADAALRLEALRAAAAIGGTEAAQALLARAAATKGEEQQKALDGLRACRGANVNGIIGEAVKTATDPARRAGLVEALGARRAADQVPVLLAATEDKDAAVRAAAAGALGAVGGGREAAVLVRMLKAAPDEAERKAAEQALLAIGPQARGPVAQAVLAALEGAHPDAAAAMLRVLGRVGGGEAAKALTALAQSADPRVQEEALRRLAGWPEREGLAEAADGLLQLAQAAQDPRRQAMALRSYIDLAGSKHWQRDKAQQLRVYANALKLAQRAEEKRAVLGGLSGMEEVRAVELAASCLEDKEVAAEAAAAIVRVAGRVKEKTHVAVQAALQKVLEVAPDEPTVKQARRLLGKPK